MKITLKTELYMRYYRRDIELGVFPFPGLVIALESGYKLKINYVEVFEHFPEKIVANVEVCEIMSSRINYNLLDTLGFEIVEQENEDLY